MATRFIWRRGLGRNRFIATRSRKVLLYTKRKHITCTFKRKELSNLMNCSDDSAFSIKRTLKEQLKFDCAAAAYSTPQNDHDYYTSFNKYKINNETSPRRLRKVTMHSDIPISDTKKRSMSIDEQFQKHNQSSNPNLLGTNDRTTGSEISRPQMISKSSKKRLTSKKEIRKIFRKLRKIKLNPESLYFSNCKKLTDEFIKEGKLKSEQETTAFKNAIKNCKNLKSYQKMPSILRDIKKGKSNFEDSLTILQNLRDKVAKDIIIEEEEQENDPMQELIDAAKLTKKTHHKFYSPFGKKMMHGSCSQEIEKHINDKEAYMAPLETRIKIMASLLTNTPNERKVKGGLEKFGDEKEMSKLSGNMLSEAIFEENSSKGSSKGDLSKMLNRPKRTASKSVMKPTYSSLNKEFKNSRIESNLLYLKRKLRSMKIQEKDKVSSDSSEYGKDLKKANNKRLLHDMKVIKKIFEKKSENSLPSLTKSRSGSLLKRIIFSCHSYENLSPRDQIKIDEDSCIEDIKHRHYYNTIDKIDPALHYREMKKNFDYQMFAYKQQIIHQDEISQEYRSGIMDPCRTVAMFERTRSLYKMLMNSQMKNKLRFNMKKKIGKYTFSSEVE
ncbi:unnamed protein product [Moneuplotes crassus]|uniref:Uncharacterized protein n=1 Tax=Euplotes crassus TaxID=5936 RepID=A0AAD2D7Y1_EUPCR|nr:unnamed protein product [Moneuplotes crassus]